MAYGGSEGGIVARQVKDQKLVVKKQKCHAKEITAIRINSSNNQIISGSEDKLIKIWSLNLLEELATLKAHKGAIKSLE